MDINELKSLLGIPLSDISKDDYYTAVLPVAIEFIENYCNAKFTTIPAGAKLAIAKLIEFFEKDSNVSSEKIADLSQTFFSNEIPQSVKTLLKPYRKVRFI